MTSSPTAAVVVEAPYGAVLGLFGLRAESQNAYQVPNSIRVARNDPFSTSTNENGRPELATREKFQAPTGTRARDFSPTVAVVLELELEYSK